MFRILAPVAKEFNKAGKTLSICGELGGDELAAPILIGLGVQKLSMSKNKIHTIKKLVCENNLTTFKKIAKRVLQFDTQDQIIEYMKTQRKE
jgi:phosphotransferase system enzyme I (PtsI)